MKKVVVYVMFMMCVLSVAAQKDTVVVRDSWHKDTIRQRSGTRDTVVQESEMIIWDNTVRASERRYTCHSDVPLKAVREERRRGRSPHFGGHWSGFYLGFVNFGNTSYSSYSETDVKDFMELDWANSFAVQINLFEHGVTLNPSRTIGLVTGIGFEYQRFRFDRDITLKKDENGMLRAELLSDLGIDRVKRSVFKTLYMTIPLLVEWQFPASMVRQAYISTGVVGGVRLHSKTKIVYRDEDGDKRRKKNSDSYGMIPLKADWTVHVGYRGMCLWGNYTLTNMFKKSKAPELHPYTIGVGFTF